MDFLKSEENLEELIMTDRFADAVHIYEARWESRESISQINKEEADINKFYLEQCKKNKFDIIITYFYSVVESLKNFDVELLLCISKRPGFLSDYRRNQE